jgi:hypothetical protein
MNKSLLRYAFVLALTLGVAANEVQAQTPIVSTDYDFGERDVYLHDVKLKNVEDVLAAVQNGNFKKEYDWGSDEAYSFFYRVDPTRTIRITPYQDHNGNLPDVDNPQDLSFGYITIQDGKPGSEEFSISNFVFEERGGKILILMPRGDIIYGYDRNTYIPTFDDLNP